MEEIPSRTIQPAIYEMHKLRTKKNKRGKRMNKKENKELLEKYGVKDLSGGTYRNGFIDGLRLADQLVQKLEKKTIKMKISNKVLDKIIELFCTVDDRKYPDGTGVWGMDTELFGTDEEETGREKAKKAILNILQEARK